MADFIGKKCPVCNADFTADDEIVVCPYCGTPHHRACYNENGKCINEELHAEGYEWADAEEEQKPLRCHNCGAHNYANAKVCVNCASELSQELPEDGEEETVEKDWLGDGRGFTGVYSIGASASALLDNERIDGVPVGDIRKFVGRAADYYAPVFYTLKKLGRSVSINFSAMIGHGMWFLSRKMYGRGLLILIIMLATYAVRAVTMVAVPELNETTLFANPGLMSSNYPLMIAYVIANVIQYAVIVISGLYGNSIYMKTCIRRVKRINSRAKNADDFNLKLSKKGSLCMPALTISATIYICGVYAVSYFAQPMLEFLQKIVDYLA